MLNAYPATKSITMTITYPATKSITITITYPATKSITLSLTWWCRWGTSAGGS